MNHALKLGLAMCVAGCALAVLWTSTRVPGELGAPAEPQPRAELDARRERQPAEFSLAPPAADIGQGTGPNQPERSEVRPSGARRSSVVVSGTLLGARSRAPEFEIRIYPRFERASAPTPSSAPFEFEALTSTSSGSAALERSPWISDDLLGFSACARPDGTFERDVSEALGDARELPLGFDVQLLHRNFEPAAVFVPLAEGGRALDGERLARGDRIVLAFSCSVQPICRVVGSATRFDSEGRVQVEVWKLAGETPVALVAEAQVERAEQLFELALPIDGRFAVVAFSEGYLPQTRTLYTFDELEVALAPFVLDRGQRFAGRVDLTRHSLGASTWVYLSREHPVLRKDRMGRHGFLWSPSGFEAESQAVRTDDQGRFVFAGLAPGNYELRLGIDREWWTEMDPVELVQVPSEGVVIRPRLAHVELRIDQAGELVDRRGVTLTGVGRGSSSGRADLATDHRGRADLWLFPGEPYLVHVAQPCGTPWVYGKVVSWSRLESVESISMCANSCP